tara:strand:- start:123 stop:476 length:354 start_codon:yes stop_codon:yes gene_type:complete
MREPIRCGLKVEGIKDSRIETILLKVHNIFNKQLLKENIKFEGNGKIEIEGIGNDSRCAFCEYFRNIVIGDLKDNKIKGSIDMIHCPFNPDKRIDYSPETQEAREKLLDMFIKMQKK